MNFSAQLSIPTERAQNTLKTDVSFSGIGIHTGRCVSMRFVPASEGTGILFKRVDLEGQPTVPAHVDYVCDTARSTTIGVGNVRIHTIEHVLAALGAYQIDNLIIELSNLEPPVADGSSNTFVEMIHKAGVQKQAAVLPIIKLQQPVYWSEGDIHLVAIPYDGYRISYTLNYPDHQALKSQYRSFEITADNFKKEIGPCRTFSLYQEVSVLMDRGLIKGGSLDNAVIIKDDVVFSKGGLHFSDEMVRHKILDMIGDLSLVGFPFLAHIIAVRGGHHANYHFAKQLLNTIKQEATV